MLSQRTRYAIRALLHLADRHGQGPVQLTEIAEAQNIPAKFLTVILSELRRAGLVATLRGKEGGYWLARAPEAISYGEVVRLTEPDMALVPCFGSAEVLAEATCPIVPACGLRGVLGEALQAFMAVLDRYTLADLAQRRVELRSLLAI